MKRLFLAALLVSAAMSAQPTCVSTLAGAGPGTATSDTCALNYQGEIINGVCRITVCTEGALALSGTNCAPNSHWVCIDRPGGQNTTCSHPQIPTYPGACPTTGGCSCVANGDGDQGGGGGTGEYCASGCYDGMGNCMAQCGWNSGSPIVIDVNDAGYHLTSADKGVMFDFFGDGRRARWAWTDPAYGNAWLVMDRNGNGKIDSAKEMFGNITEQVGTKIRNGFLALEMFDENRDGNIDFRDYAFQFLRLWIDANQDGISQQAELHTLASKHLKGIYTAYKESEKKDRYGNRFAMKGSVLLDDGRKSEKVYDVYLISAK